MDDEELTRRGQRLIAELTADGVPIDDIARMALGVSVTLVAAHSNMPLEFFLHSAETVWRAVKAGKSGVIS